VLDLLGENKDKFSENSKNEKDLIEQLGKIGIDDDNNEEEGKKKSKKNKNKGQEM